MLQLVQIVRDLGVLLGMDWVLEVVVLGKGLRLFHVEVGRYELRLWAEHRHRLRMLPWYLLRVVDEMERRPRVLWWRGESGL